MNKSIISKIKTKDDLAKISWAEFEYLVIQILNNVFEVSDDSIIFKQTRLQKDGGKDAVCMFTIAKGSLLPIEFKMWIEAKQRSKSNVEHHDLNKTILRTMIEGIDRVFIVTNRDFAIGFKNDIREFNRTTTAPFLLINGEKLLKLFNETCNNKKYSEKEYDKSVLELHVVIGVSISPEFPEFFTRGALMIDSEDIPFIVVNISTNSDDAVAIKFNLSGKMFQNDVSDIVIIANQFPVRYSYPILTKINEEIDIKKECQFQIESTRITKSKIECSGKIRIKPRYLKPVDIQSHRKEICILTNAEKEWKLNGTTQFIHIVAQAGIGKSFQLSQLKKRLFGNGFSILDLSGGFVFTPSDVFFTIIDYVFPYGQAKEKSNSNIEVKEILYEAGYSEEEIFEILDLFNLPYYQRKDVINETHSGILASIISHYIKRYKFVIIFDDLQKLYPSARAIISRLQRYLSSSKISNLFFITASRIESVDDLDEIYTQLTSVKVITLKALNMNDALLMLQSSLPNVDKEIIEEYILSQIPKTPFSIKETLAFLEGENIIQRISIDGAFQLIKPEGLIQRIRLPQLKNVTGNRYKKIINKFENSNTKWIDEFLLAGAILGRKFDQSIALKAVGQNDNKLSSDILVELINKDILNIPSPVNDGLLEFSHDLIRDTILDHQQPGRKAIASTIANKICNIINQLGLEKPVDDYLLGRLEIISGNLNKATKYLEKFAGDCEKSSKHLDAAFSYLLLIQTLDPAYFSTIQNKTKLWELFYMDSTIEKLYNPRKSNNHNIENLFKYFSCSLENFVVSGIGQEIGLDYLITEARMLAEQLKKTSAKAEIEYYHGRIVFESEDMYQESLKYHLNAKNILLDATEQNTKLEAKNLSRIFLCQRQLGQINEAKNTLQELKRILPDEIESVARCLTYSGYLNLYFDLSDCFQKWEQAADMCIKSNNLDRIIHYCIGTGNAALLLDNIEIGRKYINQAENNINKYQRYSNKARLLLSKCNLFLMDKDLISAIDCVKEGELLAIKYGIFRRLWRLEAMRATCEELAGNNNAAFEYDVRVMSKLWNRIEAEKSFGINAPWLHQRHVLPIINMMLRGNESLLKPISKTQKQEIKKLVLMIQKKEFNSLPGQLGYHFKEIDKEKIRAIITE